MTKNFVLAISTLVGAIVGLGMFGIPYTASRAGFFVGIGYILSLGIVMLLIHLIYGEVIERTKERHRLTGYVEKYLGKKWKKFAGIAIILGVYITLLAYIIVGGKFLALLFPGILDPFTLGIIFWFVLSVAVWRGMRTIAAVELGMTAFLILFVVILFVWGVGDIELQNFSAPNLSDIFLPYGVVLFALSGIFAISEIRELLKMDGKRYKQLIVWGSLIPVVIYLIFTVLVVGISGTGTSEEALHGLVAHLGAGITRLGAVFGIFAIATSYLVIGSNLKHTFEYDWHMKRIFSALSATFIPVILFILGLQKFIQVISFSGAIFGAIMGIFVVLIYQKAILSGDKEPGYVLNVPKFVLWGLVALFALGGVYEIIYLIL